MSTNLQQKLIRGEVSTMNKISIVMIEDNVELCNKFRDYFGSSEEFEVYGCAHNAEDGYNLIYDKQPDIAIMDVIFPVSDGLSILEKIQQENMQSKPMNVIFTRVNSDMMGSEAIALGADYIFLKPFDLSIMKKRLIQMYEHRCGNSTSHKISNDTNIIEDYTTHEKYLQRDVTSLMFNLGIPSHVKGYKCIKHAVVLSMENEELLESVTKLLYPELAKDLGINYGSVEHSIRNAIKSAWKKNNKNKYYKQLGFNDEIENKPTSKTLILSMVQYLNHERSFVMN